MLSDSTTFYYVSCFERCVTKTLIASGDTNISSVKFKFLYGFEDTTKNYFRIGLIREDTLNRKVFYRKFLIKKSNTLFSFDSLSSEFVLYDFNLVKGDSIFLLDTRLLELNYYSNQVDTLGYYKVDTVYTITSKNISRRTIHLENKKLNDGISKGIMDWSEGLGALNQGYIAYNGADWLHCKFDNEKYVYTSMPNNAYYFIDELCDSSCSCTGIGYNELIENKLRITQDKLFNYIAIESDLEENVRCNIYNSSGQQVSSRYQRIPSQIEIKALSSGIYILEILKSNCVSRFKFIKS